MSIISESKFESMQNSILKYHTLQVTLVIQKISQDWLTFVSTCYFWVLQNTQRKMTIPSIFQNMVVSTMLVLLLITQPIFLMFYQSILRVHWTGNCSKSQKENLKKKTKIERTMLYIFFLFVSRFAQFFLGPLFTESATEREINAVNSEFEKNVPLDGWRLLQLDKHVSKASHPYHKFGIGSLKTLSIVPKEKGINIREELLKFHHKWYSSNIMTLVILGKESLDELEKLGKSLFLSVPNHNVEQPEWKEHPYGPEHLQIKSYVVPIKDTRTIHICFPAPDFHEHYKSGVHNSA